MMGGEIFLWIAIVSSGIMLFGYSIWNLIVVSRDFINIAREAKKHL